jgi:3-oxoacyl-[acyl-carrier protein] reductase
VPDRGGRTALVTGASRGIGRAVAVGFAGEGGRVALAGRDPVALAETARACAGEPLELVYDVTSADACAAAARRTLESFDGRLDLLANVAGSAMRRAPLDDLGDDDWARSLELHVTAPARMARLCLPGLSAARGAIVNVGSIVASRGARLGAPYAAAKAALVSLTRTTAVEWARLGIRANLVEPGYVDTEFNAELVEAGLEPRLLAKVPTGRPISPEAVARAVLFLGSPGSGDVNGAVLRVDGGWTARL